LKDIVALSLSYPAVFNEGDWFDTSKHSTGRWKKE